MSADRFSSSRLFRLFGLQVENEGAMPDDTAMNEKRRIKRMQVTTHPADTAAMRRFLTDRLSADIHLYETSFQANDGVVYALIRHEGTKKLVVSTEEEVPFEREAVLEHSMGDVLVAPLSAENARRLRGLFPWTAPTPLGRTSALGCGDRLGLATPGHLRACRPFDMRPILAQQSIREMERTGRSPQEVLDDVTWAVFQEGFCEGFGADADHLKTTEDVDRCLAAGYTMYTIDPSDYVDDEADTLEEAELAQRFAALPWAALETTPDECVARYAGHSLEVDGEHGTLTVQLDEEALRRAAVKYGAALAHTKKMARHLAHQYRKDRPGEAYDLEVSVDETASPTLPREHYFIAAELDRLGVAVTSLAPRFVGDFQKGIDFIGDLAAFERSFRKHAILAEALGDYKLSVHSGSDKFSVYPIIGRYAGDRVHLKTAGTSYLEALRLPARHVPDLFRDMVAHAFDRFETDRATYHVTTDLSAIPAPEAVPDEALEATYLDENNGRQLLHITYGSVLSAARGKRFKAPFFEVLDTHEEEHYAVIEAHLGRHLAGLGS